MKIAFCTCVQIGLSCIEAIIESGQSFELLITLHDHKSKKKSGRIYLDEIAATTKTPLFKINHINDEEVADALRKYQIDWLFIIGWSQIASPELIKVPKKGVIGAHPTLLPVGRGRAAVPWAIIKGLDKTGVTLFKMDEGVDTGPILDQYEIQMSSEETATELYAKVNEAHIKLMLQIWPKLMADTIESRVQNETLATYWEGRTPADGQLFSTMTVEQVDRLVRATTRPYPGAFIITEKGARKIIWKGSTQLIDGAEFIDFKDGSYYILDSEII